jgi:hypothetical protein
MLHQRGLHSRERGMGAKREYNLLQQQKKGCINQKAARKEGCVHEAWGTKEKDCTNIWLEEGGVYAWRHGVWETKGVK